MLRWWLHLSRAKFSSHGLREERRTTPAKTNGEFNWPDRSTNWKSCQASRKTTDQIDCIMRANNFTFRLRIVYSPFLTSRYLFLFSLCGLSIISAFAAIDNAVIKFRIRYQYYFILSFATLAEQL